MHLFFFFSTKSSFIPMIIASFDGPDDAENSRVPISNNRWPMLWLNVDHPDDSGVQFACSLYQ